MTTSRMPDIDIYPVSPTDLQLLCRHLEAGGIGVLRSDTVVAAVCRAFSVPTVRQLDVVLDHHDMPYSVNLADIDAATRWIEPATADYRILDAHTPGPVTLVGQVVRKPAAVRLSTALNADGTTLGVRISSSRDELRLARLMRGPFVTAAVAIDGQPAATVADAAEYLRERLSVAGIPQRLMAVRDPRATCNDDLSTVVRTRPEGRFRVVEIIRAGAIPERELEATVATPWTAREIEDVT